MVGFHHSLTNFNFLNSMKMRRLLLFIGALIVVQLSYAQTYDPKLFSQLRFRFIGPDGKRIIAAGGEPGNTMVAYARAASGCIWKTEQQGTTWKSLFDNTEQYSIRT